MKQNISTKEYILWCINELYLSLFPLSHSALLCVFSLIAIKTASKHIILLITIPQKTIVISLKKYFAGVILQVISQNGYYPFLFMWLFLLRHVEIDSCLKYKQNPPPLFNLIHKSLIGWLGGEHDWSTILFIY